MTVGKIRLDREIRPDREFRPDRGFRPDKEIWGTWKSDLGLQPCGHRAESLSSVGDVVFLLLCDVCKSKSRILVSNEDRVVTETSVS